MPLASRCRLFPLLLLFWGIFAPRVWSADWPPIAPEDLKMTELSELKGAPAVVLLREEIADDPNNYHSVYMRIKILTEAGRRYADVEIPYAHRNFTVDGISGRTVHADGTIIPLEGKAFDKVVLKERMGRSGQYQVNVKAFTLPDVQIGSILDLRYTVRYDDHRVVPPEWEVQLDLYQKKATFKYTPYDGEVIVDHGRIGRGAAWSGYLPDNIPRPQLHQVVLPSVNAVHRSAEYVDYSVTNLAPFIKEPFMPPSGMFRHRVQFYYTVNPTPDAYWKDEGKFWNKDVEKFINRKGGVDEAVAKIVAPTDAPDQKLRKIYAFVTGLENRSYLPKSTETEKASGFGANDGVEDVLRQKSGDHDDLNRLFVAMVRAAGLPASMMWVASREETFFQPELLTTHQLDGEIAIVQLGGKDIFLDPGTKYCPYGLLDWRYSGSKGLRQSAKGTEFAESSRSEYSQAQILRSAHLQLTDDGKVGGTVKIGFYGLEAMDRRQKAAATDAEGRKRLLEDEVRIWLPANSEVTLTGSPNWDETEPHLATEFKISSPLAIGAGKRWLIPVHVFQVNGKPVFTATERMNAVYLWYCTREIDEVHMTLPPTIEVESLPANDSIKLDYAVYTTVLKQENANEIMARRDVVMAGFAFPQSKYKELKDFYDKVKAGDDQQMIARGAGHADAK